MDCREGEPDRSGTAAIFEGYFDLETGEPRRLGTGYPRLRVVAPPAIAAAADPAPEPLVDAMAGTAPVAVSRPVSPPVERLWGWECWWRPDPARGGVTPEDHEALEESKRLLRGLLRDTRRPRSLQPR